MNWLIEQLVKEWGVIKRAPITFGVIVILSLVSAYFLTDYIYKQRIQSKDDMLAYYREKLGLNPASKTPYSGLRNPELKREALSVVSALRDLSEQAKASTSQILKEYTAKSRADKTEEEALQDFEQMNLRTSKATSDAMAIYDKDYKVNVLFLRDETLSRLPEGKRRELLNERTVQSVDSSFLSFPTNPIGLGIAADVLERLAKSLPES